MTIIEQVRETFQNVETGSKFTTIEIKSLVHKKFGTNIGSVIPSDYSYNMTNKGKGDYAYALIDVDTPVTEDVVEKLKAIDGVLKVRIIK